MASRTGEVKGAPPQLDVTLEAKLQALVEGAALASATEVTPGRAASLSKISWCDRITRSGWLPIAAGA